MATWGAIHNLDNFQQLEFSIGAETSEILEYVIENVALPKLQELIERDVYSYNEIWDGRTYQFKYAWEMKLQKQGFYNNVILFLNEDELDYGYPNPFTHITYSASGLAEIINDGWNSGTYPNPPMNFPIMSPRPYWDDFIEWLNNDFEYEFLKECNRRGLNMTITGDLYF